MLCARVEPEGMMLGSNSWIAWTWVEGFAMLWKEVRAGDGGVPLDLRVREPLSDVDDVRAPMLVALREEDTVAAAAAAPAAAEAAASSATLVRLAEDAAEGMACRLLLALIGLYSPGMVVVVAVVAAAVAAVAVAGPQWDACGGGSWRVEAMPAAACARPVAWACCMSRGEVAGCANGESDWGWCRWRRDDVGCGGGGGIRRGWSQSRARPCRRVHSRQRACDRGVMYGGVRCMHGVLCRWLCR